MPKRDIVSFLSDYGLEDEFVGVCHGVILGIAPHVRVIDIHHNILRQDIRHGAVVLRQTAPFIPESVHLAVVDPSVGSSRRAIALETKWGEVFVGPDNGLLLPAATVRGGIKAAYELTDARFHLTPVSRTFQGRDVFAPVAAHVANGSSIADLGPSIDVEDLVSLEIPEAWVHDDHLHAEVLQIDRFGNLQLNFGVSSLTEVGLSEGTVLEVRLEGHRLRVPFGKTFADVKAGEFVLVEDSYKSLSLAINKGDAAQKLRAGTGSTVIVGPGPS
ncbi:MAG TPA: SAM-dependent chlorinase/fluorinase [Actinomycetota bacterium]|nr:SAM-dependent chlorinase/fluorinase [Actinomycetota bacterium]